MKILVTGGCGYKGTILVPKLLACGYQVQVLDAMWFGNFLEDHQNRCKFYRMYERTLNRFCL